MRGVPEAPTWLIRSAHSAWSPIFAPVHSSAAAVTRSGWSSISCRPTAPPTETPA